MFTAHTLVLRRLLPTNNMTTVYFVRHSKADNSVRDDAMRPLTEQGMKTRWVIAEYLGDKGVNVVLASPYKRTIDTVAELAEKNGLIIEEIYDFRERKPDSKWLTDDEFFDFVGRQWADLDYKLSDGESLREVQRRNIVALNDVLKRYKGKTIAVGTHGTALSTIINYYEPQYGHDDFWAMVKLTPWVVKMQFEGEEFKSIEKIDVLAMYNVSY